jgi:VWFA-related protein
LKEGDCTAVLVLDESLSLLQDFTTEPGALSAALDGTLAKKSSELDGHGIQKFTPGEAQALLPSMLRTIDRLNQAHAAESIDVRLRMTLAALSSIARATSGIPGRKNLIWVSSVFPLTLQPGHGEYPEAQRAYGDEIRRTAALLASAQVAVYPVDARGLIVGNVTGENSSALVQTIESRDGISIEEDLANSHEAMLGAHQTMRELAKETGGLALYNRNNITRAIALSAADGKQYYTLGYYPEAETWDGKFHRVNVKIGRKGLDVRHRAGYFAVDTSKTFASDNAQQRKQRAFEDLRASLVDPLPATEITFRAQILVPEIASRAQVHAQFLVDAAGISFEELGDGIRRCNLDFLLAAISPDGKVVATDERTVDARLKPDRFTQANQNGLPFSMQLPLSPGNYTLHLAVRDNRTGLLGTLGVRLSLQAP